ncbi:hypothetical protein Catovirus_1_805 [Catovirus CTV1]|uniref:Uncharacterized protein n=1 Tax=Catovirus CTV1 TaxID=1977631 RepID=A0A1V0SAK5_9VIRU|nr:hypothetical protein Catovirus_1_805 [Catovirus CTV1]
MVNKGCNCGGNVISNNCSNCCTRKSRESSMSNNRTISAFNSALDYKESQKETLISLKDLLTNVISSIQNSFCNDGDCFKDSAMNAADQYVSVSNRTCEGKKIAVVGNGNFYGTVQDISGESKFPIYYVNGFGGIKETHDISGTLIYDLNGLNQTSFLLNSDQDVAFLAKKIRSKICGYVSVVDGTEIGIKIDGSGNSTFVMTVLSAELGNCFSTFTVPTNASIQDFENLVTEMKDVFEQYICRIWYDMLDETIRIIFNAGYSVFISNQVDSVACIIYESFINDKLVTSVQVCAGDNYVAYGYLEFYSSCHSLVIRYPPGALAETSEDVPMTIIYPSDDGYCNNITFNLENLWCCVFDTIAKICVQYDMCYRNAIKIEAFYAWSMLLKYMVRCLKFDCTVYDNWRKCNVSKNISSLISLLNSLIIVIENQKDLVEIMKCDYIEFVKKCCNGIRYSRKC